MHGAEWQNARTTGVMANSQALIPLIGITLDSIHFIAKTFIYTLQWLLGLHIRESFHLPIIYTNV